MDLAVKHEMNIDQEDFKTLMYISTWIKIL